jgi:thiol:disulfide interchange protein
MVSNGRRNIARGAGVAALVVVLGALGGGWAAQTAAQVAPSADAVVSAAVKTAAAERKVVLVEFGASWCTWCRSFEAFVRSAEAGPVIANNFVVTNLTVQERDDKKALENPGGQDAMNKWGGSKSGLPFYVFLDAKGNKIADSNAMPDGTNIGFPATAKEVELFLELIDRTAPRLAKADRARILEYLKKDLK